MKNDINKKRLPVRPFLTVSFISAFFISLTILYSCSSHSVRAIKENKMAESVQTAGYKSPKDALIKDLFMQYNRVNIDFPDSPEKKTVDVRKIDTVIGNKEGKDITVSYTANIPITTFKRNVMEQNGKVDIDFLINIPKEYLATYWSLTLSPKIELKDSVVQLKEVILKGEEFYAKQVGDYRKYDEYLKSIVDNSQYDSIFVDYQGVEKDLRNRQNLYWEVYNKDWRLQMEYESWKSENETLKLKLEAEKIARERNLYQDYSRKILNETMVELAKGNDTTGIYNKYMNQYDKEVAKIPKFYEKREKALEKIPSRFKEIHEAKRSIDDLSNKALSEGDSIMIAKHRYRFDKIAENELRKAQKEEKFKEMVQFPFRKDALMDSIINPEKDYIIRYKEQIEVPIDEARIKVILNGKVNAVDMSSYIIPQADTLLYAITSLSQLADTALMYTETHIRRNETESVTAYTDFKPNDPTFDIRLGKNKGETSKIINLYNTISNSSEFALDSIVISASSSLDGPADKNLALSKRRANSLKEYLVRTLPRQADANNLIKTASVGEDWKTFGELIEKRSDLLYKKLIVETLAEGVKDPDGFETQIKREFRTDYKIIQDSIYPLLRKVDAVFYIHRPAVEKDYVKKELDSLYQEGIQHLLNRQYPEAYAVLSPYDDYNTALSLASLNQSEKAIELLAKLPSTAKSEYLLALLSLPSKNETKTLQHITKALRLDPSIATRDDIDDRIKALIKKYKL